MIFNELAKSRFSVRKFDGRHVKKSKLKTILEAGRLAPSAKNIQGLKFYVIQTKEGIEKINSVCQCIYGASTVLLVCYDKKLSWKNPFDQNIDGGVIDASIALTHMMLASQEQGVNSCWVQYFNPVEVKKVFNLPENIVPVSIMPLGYACEDVEPSDNHKSRKSLEELVVNV